MNIVPLEVSRVSLSGELPATVRINPDRTLSIVQGDTVLITTEKRLPLDAWCSTEEIYYDHGGEYRVNGEVWLRWGRGLP